MGHSDGFNAQIHILKKVSTMVKQKQVKKSPKSAQKSAKSPKSMRWQDYVSILPPEELYGKVVDPKIIEKIIAKNRANRAMSYLKLLVTCMMDHAKKDKIKVTKEMKEACAEIAKDAALKTAERAFPYPKLNKNGVVLNWMTTTAGCRPSWSFVQELLEKSICQAKSQTKPNPVKQNSKAKPVVVSKTILQKKHINKKVSMQPDSIKVNKAKNTKPMTNNKELKKKAMTSTATCTSRNESDKPTYKEMIITAIRELKEKRGSSRQAIMKH